MKSIEQISENMSDPGSAVKPKFHTLEEDNRAPTLLKLEEVENSSQDNSIHDSSNLFNNKEVFKVSKSALSSFALGDTLNKTSTLVNKVNIGSILDTTLNKSNAIAMPTPESDAQQDTQ